MNQNSKKKRIIDPNLPQEVRNLLKTKVIEKIEQGRRALKLDTLVRNDQGGKISFSFYFPKKPIF